MNAWLFVASPTLTALLFMGALITKAVWDGE
jgi:hypothetical protein